MKQDNNGTLSKAKIWWDKLSIDDKILLTQKHFIGIPLHTLMDKSIEAMYIYENPQPTDTGNTVSSEVGFTGGEWNMYISEKGKDGCSRAYINSALPNDMYETICTMAGLNGTEPGEQAKANAQRIVQAVNNHDALVSALKEAMDIIERMDTDINSSPTRTEHKRLTDLLNNISNK